MTLVNGTPIGGTGTGIFAAFKLSDGDDFDSTPSRWSARNPTGRYSCPHLSNASRVTSLNTDEAMWIDPAWRGARSESPVDLGIDRVSVANSILKLSGAAPEPEIYAYLPTNFTGVRGDAEDKPLLLSGTLKTGPSFMISAQGDWILACKVRYPAGNIRGFWPSFWLSTYHWPDFGEVDIMEGKKISGNIASTSNVIVSATDGAGPSTEAISSPPSAPNVWVQYVVARHGDVITVYDDIGSPGNVTVRGQITSALVQRLRGAHDVRLNFAVSTNWDGSTFDAANWPNFVEFDWWQAWTPVAGGDKTPAQMLPAVNTTAGGSWAASFPSKAALFGAKAGIEQVNAAWDNADAPGQPSRNSATNLPTSMTVDLTARTVAGTVPANEGGRVFVLLTFAYDDGTPAARAFLPFNVAPVFKTLFSNATLDADDPFSATIAYTDFHSGNLGHTYTVTQSGGTGWLNIVGNGTSQVSITGTAPDLDSATTLTINCTNSAGQTTTLTRTVSTISSTSFNPTTWADVVEWWDANNTSKVFSDTAGTIPAVSGTIGSFYGVKNNIPLINASGASQPTYVTDANGKKAIGFTIATNTRLWSADAALVAAATGDDKAYAIIVAAKRGTPDITGTLASWSRDDAGTVDDYLRHYFDGVDAASVQRSVAAAITTVSSAAETVPANLWYVATFIFSGTTMTTRINGVVVANAVAMNTAAVTLHRFAIGGTFRNTALNDFEGGKAFGGRIGEIGIINAIATNDATMLAAEAYLMAKWTN